MKIQYNSPVILTYALICAGVYLFNTLTANVFKPLFVLSADFNFFSPADYFSLVSYVVGHDNLDHLLGNMLFILLLGPIMEEKYGARRLIGMIVMTALLTAIFYIMLFGNQGLIGASGIVFMFIILVSFANVQHGKIPLTFILIFLLYVGKELYNAFYMDNVSQYGHIAGGIIGSIFGFSTSVRRHKSY